MDNDFTTVTIIKGRRKQLENQYIGIIRNSIQPQEHIIVAMDEDPISLPKGNVPIRIIRVSSTEQTLPLAQARNEGWRMASTENIIFLDVDCIPSPLLFEILLKNIDDSKVVTSYPRYLKIVPESSWTYDNLYQSSIEHPDRASIPAHESVEPELFWSLVFACKKQTLEATRGFDEGYTGYGAEDTDFALTAHQMGIDIQFVEETVLHQYHDKYNPPLQHFNDIIMNATYFYRKWHVWPMTGWLQAFEQLHLVRLHDDRIEIIGSPTKEMVEEAQSKSPY